jgi:hypothetical protein
VEADGAVAGFAQERLQEQRRQQQQQQQRQLQVVGGYAAEVTSSTSSADTAAAGTDKAAVSAPKDGTMQAAASDAGSRPVVRFSGPLPSSSSGLPVPQQQQQASGAAVATVPFHQSSSAGQLQQISELASLDEAGASAITAAMQAAKD